MFKVNVEEIDLEVLHDIPNYSRYAADLKTDEFGTRLKVCGLQLTLILISIV